MLDHTLRIFKDTGLPLRHVVHVGMHRANEQQKYKDAGCGQITYVEANPALCSSVQSQLGHLDVICAAISDKVEDREFLVTSNDGQSSSLLQLGSHKQHYPKIVVRGRIPVRTETLTSALERSKFRGSSPDLLVLDIQGAELEALRGFDSLGNVPVVQTEVNYGDVYVGNGRMNDVHMLMLRSGFFLAKFSMNSAEQGDAIFLNRRYWQLRDYNFTPATAPLTYMRTGNGLVDRTLRIVAGRCLAHCMLHRQPVFFAEQSSACPGQPWDVFMPLRGVRYEPKPSPGSRLISSRATFCDWRAASLLLAYGDGLLLRPKLRGEVLSLLDRWTDLLAVHVRRTDKLHLGQHGMRYMKDVYPVCDAHDGRIYLATDTPDVQKLMRERYGDRVVWYADIQPSGKTRKTSLAHAAVDIAMCVSAARFDGDPCSSWYQLIHAFREAGRTMVET